MKTLIVTDSTSGISLEEAKQIGIEVVPLSIIIDGKEYKDLVELSSEMLLSELEKGKVPSTSQPNLGYIQERMEAWKSENYDQIIIYTLTRTLSGTYQAFILSKDAVGLDNATIIDTGILCGPLREAVIQANEMAKAGLKAEEIIEKTKHIYNNHISFVYPKTLEQLKKGGRVSGTVATLSALLKIKPLLALESYGPTIEKHSTHRTDSKVFQTILDEYKQKGVNETEYKMFIPHARGEETLEQFINAVKQTFPKMEIEIMPLPAVLVAHAGIGTIAAQCVRK